jgi:hypothetical protein
MSQLPRYAKKRSDFSYDITIMRKRLREIA